jgi:hypothetical protein
VTGGRLVAQRAPRGASGLFTRVRALRAIPGVAVAVVQARLAEVATGAGEAAAIHVGLVAIPHFVDARVADAELSSR